MGWVINATSRPLYSPGKTRYEFYRRLGGAQGRWEGCGESHPSPGFDPRTVHTVASHFTDWAIPVQMINNNNNNNNNVSITQIYIYTGCPRRNGQNFGRVFLMLNYTDITQNTYIQSWTVTEILAREFETLTVVTHLLITKYVLKLAGICGFCNVNICT